MLVNDEMKKEFVWWCLNIYFEIRYIFRGKLEVMIKIDVLLLGWGVIYDYENIEIGGRLKKEEKINYINYLEMFVIYFGLRFFENLI